ncbi:MAG: phenylalanine--tRNA ligase beta subunit [Oligoflexia bacterium]|nr:MAG: phenylalanine--tRNA ligase beta subunit [Oligoflexia bacterium]
MKMSLRWLQDFVDVTEFLQKPEILADLLTKAGLEVEEIVNKSKDFQYVVTGLILEKEKHPQADKLSLCKVTTGEGVVHQIVCGAQNHKANDRVVVALPGAILPGNFAIKQSTIRGVESGGMLCSEKELGLQKESQGIMILPDSAPLGVPFAQYAGLDDVTFELKVTPNRADCLSHFGLAREIACLLSRPLKSHASQIKFTETSTKAQIQLEVRQPDLCPRYAGRVISGVKVGPSPSWLQKRLESVGLNSINNIVDVTNYVMMEMGQPLHAFDLEQVQNKKIIVDKAQSGEKFQTLDGTTLTLTGEELMIKDGARSVAMAGVVGGQNSGVTEKTVTIFLEAAYFLPMAVRKASRLHGINTDSGYRFSRGVDPDGTVRAMDRAVELILQVGGGVACGDHHDFYPSPVRKHPVNIHIQTVTDRLGYTAQAPLFENFMTRLGCVVEKLGDTEFRVLPPTFRFDIEHEMDLVEEYARLNGYEHIPDAQPWTVTAPTNHDLNFRMNNRVTQMMVHQGYQQAMNLAFVSEKLQKDFVQNFNALIAAGLVSTEKQIKLMNPLSDDLNTMRSTISLSLFQNLKYNYHQGNQTGRLFEIGKTFYLKPDGSYGESWRLGICAWGIEDQLWLKGQNHPLAFEVKACLEALLGGLNVTSYQWQMIENKSEVPSFLHRGQNATLAVEGKKIGFIGALHPVLLDQEKIRTQVAFAEIELESLYRGQPRISKFESVSKFPAVERDLALVMGKKIRAQDVVREMKKLGGVNLVGISIFDLYEGDKLEVGQKSVAYRLKYQDRNATLQDEVINKSIETILNGLKQKFSIQVR